MEIKLVKYRTGYLGISDEGIKVRDYYIIFSTGGFPKIYQCEKRERNRVYYGSRTSDDIKECKKILFTTPDLKLEGVPLIDLSMESNEVSREYSDHYIQNSDYIGVHNQNSIERHFEAGYNKAKETYKFTEEDIRETIKLARERKGYFTLDGVPVNDNHTFTINEILEQLSKEKIPRIVEVETYIKSFSFMGKREDIIKINTRTVNGEEWVIVKSKL